MTTIDRSTNDTGAPKAARNIAGSARWVGLACGLGVAIAVLGCAPGGETGANDEQSATAGSEVAAAEPRVDPAALVDPALVPVLPQAAPRPLNTESLAAARSFPPPSPLPPPAPQPRTVTIPGPTDAPELRVVLVDPQPEGETAPRPAFVHVHGGGYVLGSADLFVTGVQQLADRCECLVVSVDYRIAPETPFPGALEDAYAALRWVHEHAEELRVDPTRVAVGGESAGGGLAAQLAIAARDRGEYPVAFQLLIYPMLDDRTGSTRPVPPHIGTYVWDSAANVFGWTSYLGVPAGSESVPAGAVPARVGDLSGLAPAYIGVGALDLFVQEDIEYAQRLAEAGVPVELHVVPGAFHGFDFFAPQSQMTLRFVDTWTRALRQALGIAAAGG